MKNTFKIINIVSFFGLFITNVLYYLEIQNWVISLLLIASWIGVAIGVVSFIVGIIKYKRRTK